MKLKILGIVLLFFFISVPAKAQMPVGVGLKAPSFSLEYAGGKGKKIVSDELINKKILILHFWKFN